MEDPAIIVATGSKEDLDATGPKDGTPGAPQGDPNGSPGRTDEAVPGPITRLFVIANRGISNLIQDIIL
ncbi:hypothetical protein PV326_001634, partial [Microctonus aethiopoides]